MPTTVVMSGPGTTTIVDDAAAAIILQNGLITAQNATLVSMLAAQQATASNLELCSKTLDAIHKRMMEANAQAVKSSGDFKTMLTGMANISNTLTAQATVQKMSYIDQQKNNQFQQATTNASLARGGHPPTVVPPVDIVTTVQATIQDVTMLNAQVKVTNIVTNTIEESIIGATETSAKWFAQTVVGSFLIEQYALLKAGVSYVFSSEFIEDSINAAKRLINKVKSGG